MGNGNKSKRRQEHINLGDMADDHRQDIESTEQSNTNKRRDRGSNGTWTPTTPNNRDDDETSGGEESSDPLNDLELGDYLALIQDLKLKSEASRRVAEDVLAFYTRHQLEIEKIDATRQQLNEMTTKCNDYRITIASFKEVEGIEEQKLAKEKAAVEKNRKKLDVLLEEAARHEQQLAEEKSKFEDMIKKREAQQLLKLQEEKAKIEREHNKQYAKQVEDLAKTSQKSQDADKKKISDLQLKNEELAEGLEKQKRQLKDAEKRCRDTEKLRSLSETEVEELSQRLKVAENEFGLCAKSTEYLHVSKDFKPRGKVSLTRYSQSEFLKIHNEVEAISLRYVQQIKVDDLDAATHGKIEDADADFISVPFSNSLVSKELCLAHFQRVISSKLQANLWQPFSSEITVQDLTHTSLLNQTYDRLVKSSHKGESSLRAARTCAALIIRSLHSQSKSTKRAEIFTDEVVKVLSLVLSPKTYPALRKDLMRLATNAISLWEVVQNDERELEVHSTLDPTSFEKPEDNIDIKNSRIFVLYPCVTARSCPPRRDARPIGPPGGWVDSKPEVPVEEICIHKGVGLPEWGQLVRAGEEEEVDRMMKQQIANNEKKRKELEEEMEKLSKPGQGHKWGSSYSRRNSEIVAKSTSSSPTST